MGVGGGGWDAARSHGYSRLSLPHVQSSIVNSRVNCNRNGLEKIGVLKGIVATSIVWR